MTDPKPAEKANTAVKTGDHDRVVMLSLNADGTPNQVNPEIIGDKEFALAAAQEQFAQQAVSAIDQEKRAELGLAGPAADEDTSDAAIDALKAEHDKAADAAKKAAAKVVDALHKG